MTRILDYAIHNVIDCLEILGIFFCDGDTELVLYCHYQRNAIQ